MDYSSLTCIIKLYSQNYTKMNSHTTTPSFSFIQKENVAQSDRFNRVNCNHRPNSSQHIKDKKFKRKKTQINIFSIINRILNRKTKQVFNRLLRFTNFQNKAQEQSTYSCLFSQNSKAKLNFLGQLRKQKLQTYIHFKAQENQNYSTKVYKLMNLLCRLCQRRESYAILQMNRHFEESKYKTNQLTVLSGLKQATQTSEVQNSGLLFYKTPQKHKNVRISYLKVRINDQEQVKNSFFNSADPGKNNARFISIRNVQKSKGKKQYEFRSLDNKLLKMNRKNNCVF